MQKWCSLFIVGLCAVIITASSCAKHLNDTSAERLVSYSLTTSNFQPFSDVIYTNGDGAQVSASAADTTTIWTNTVATTMHPFNAQMEVKGLNNTSATINYTIYIYVDGVMQATKQDSVVKFASFDSQISFVAP